MILSKAIRAQEGIPTVSLKRPTAISPRRVPRKRGIPENEEIWELKEKNTVLEMQLRSVHKQNKKFEEQLANVTVRAPSSSKEGLPGEQLSHASCA